jgi:hypothetical protein
MALRRLVTLNNSIIVEGRLVVPRSQGGGTAGQLSGSYLPL